MLSEGYLPSSLSLSSSSIDAPPLSADPFSVGAVLLRIVSGKPPADFLLGRKAPGSFRDEVYISRGLGDAMEGLLAMGLLSLDASSGFTTLRDATNALRSAALNPDAPLAPRPRFDTDAGSELAVAGTGNMMTGSGTARRPAGTKIKLTVTPSRLEIVLPNEGLSGNTLGVGGFTVAWNAVVGTWTLTAITGGAPILFTAFSIPFWLAGAGLARDTFKSGFVSTKLVINRGTFSLVEEALGRQRTVVEGQTRDLQGSRVVTAAVLQDGQPVRALELIEGVNAYKIGTALQEAEVMWLSAAVNEFLGNDLASNLESL